MLDVELHQGNINGLMQNLVRFGPDYMWLRNRRNHLLHVDNPGPAVTVSDLKQDAGRLEHEARRAIAHGESGFCTLTGYHVDQIW